MQETKSQGFDPWVGRSPAGERGNPLQYSCLENPRTLAVWATAAAKSLQSRPTLCDPIPGILQARTQEWVAISFSNA